MTIDFCSKINYKIGGVILQSPLLSVIRTMYNVDKTYQFDMFTSIDKLKKINQNMMIIHGDKDEIISFEDGKYIFDNLKKEIFSVFVKIENGTHNIGLRSKFKDCFPDIKEFICKTSNKNNICELLLKNESRKSYKDISKSDKKTENLNKRNINNRYSDDKYLSNKLKNMNVNQNPNYFDNVNFELNYKNHYSDTDLRNPKSNIEKFSEVKLFSFESLNFKYGNKKKAKLKSKLSNINDHFKTNNGIKRVAELDVSDKKYNDNIKYNNSLEIDLHVRNSHKIDDHIINKLCLDLSSSIEESDHKLFDLKSKLFKCKDKDGNYFKSKKSYEEDESNISIQEIELQLKIMNEQEEIENKNKLDNDNYKEIDLSKCVINNKQDLCDKQLSNISDKEKYNNDHIDYKLSSDNKNTISTDSFFNIKVVNEFINTKQNKKLSYKLKRCKTGEFIYFRKENFSKFYDIMSFPESKCRIKRSKTV